MSNVELKTQPTNFDLTTYPAAIAQNAVRLADVDGQIIKLKRAMANLESEADMAVVFEPEYKNERKAVIAHKLLANQVYQGLLLELDKLNVEKAVIAALLEQLRSEFSVKKLEVKVAIASKMTGLDSVELLGV